MTFLPVSTFQGHGDHEFILNYNYVHSIYKLFHIPKYLVNNNNKQ